MFIRWNKFLLLLLCLFSATAAAKKSTYIYTDHRFNFVKLEAMDKDELKKLEVNHPLIVSQEQVRSILKEIKLSRTFVVKKETETQDIFDESAVNFIAPKLVEALSMATDKDKITVSYLTKDPKFVLRDDRLTIVTVWAHVNELHFEFQKLLAKLEGDYDKRGDFSRIIARSRGLRVSLAVRDGQAYGRGTDELVVDLNHDFAKAAAETADASEGASSNETIKEIIVTTPPITAKERLKELEQLKEDGLITEKEYKKKRKDILKGL
ncbi:MAG: hypothetical protein HYU98_01750 [Deltaproteobacteria bacterium]|nr:hypothetical protein [Deltaproteobacteria bacterium]